MAGIPVEFVLFGLTLLAVACAHTLALRAALMGLAAIVAWKLAVAGFATGPGFAGLAAHLGHVWPLLANLFLLLAGFALLARHVEASGLPDALPAYLPSGPAAGFALLAAVFALSAVLDNIAAALIGGTIANHVFRGRVHTGYVAGLAAAANAGGAGSVIGDTTTTMLWISGIGAQQLAVAFVPSLVAFAVFAVPASLQQHALMPAVKPDRWASRIDGVRLSVAILILLVAVASSVALSVLVPMIGDQIPALGLTVMAMVVVTAPVRRPDWGIVPGAAKSAAFLVALVLAASLMPVGGLASPTAGWTFGLGVLSAALDNIPLTALALEQGGYDWALLAYAAGFGGSMLWFGSSAGVAISGIYPAARSSGNWLRAAWHIPLAYVAGFAAYMLLLGWRPG